MKRILTVFIILLFASPIFAKDSGTINVVVKNIKNNQGKLRLKLIEIRDKFSKKPGQICKTMSNVIRYKQSFFSLKNIPYGWYAIYVYHDKNNNGKFDYMKLSKPQEGFGCSNNGVSDIGNPNFEIASFYLGKKKLSMVIPLNYY